MKEAKNNAIKSFGSVLLNNDKVRELEKLVKRVFDNSDSSDNLIKQLRFSVHASS